MKQNICAVSGSTATKSPLRAHSRASRATRGRSQSLHARPTGPTTSSARRCTQWPSADGGSQSTARCVDRTHSRLPPPAGACSPGPAAARHPPPCALASTPFRACLARAHFKPRRRSLARSLALQHSLGLLPRKHFK